jgi:hypothetical protein
MEISIRSKVKLIFFNDESETYDSMTGWHFNPSRRLLCTSLFLFPTVTKKSITLTNKNTNPVFPQ